MGKITCAEEGGEGGAFIQRAGVDIDSITAVMDEQLILCMEQTEALL